MANQRLSAEWIREVLLETYPQGVPVWTLLEDLAQRLAKAGASNSSKARLAKRFYEVLEGLQKKRLVAIDRCLVMPTEFPEGLPPQQDAPIMGSLLKKRLFLALLAEDRNSDGSNAKPLRVARQEFLAQALEEGWDLAQAASALNLTTTKAMATLVGHPSHEIAIARKSQGKSTTRKPPKRPAVGRSRATNEMTDPSTNATAEETCLYHMALGTKGHHLRWHRGGRWSTSSPSHWFVSVFLVTNLERQGLVFRVDEATYAITPKGRKAVAALHHPTEGDST